MAYSTGKNNLTRVWRLFLWGLLLRLSTFYRHFFFLVVRRYVDGAVDMCTALPTTYYVLVHTSQIVVVSSATICQFIIYFLRLVLDDFNIKIIRLLSNYVQSFLFFHTLACKWFIMVEWVTQWSFELNNKDPPSLTACLFACLLAADIWNKGGATHSARNRNVTLLKVKNMYLRPQTTQRYE